MSDWKRNAVFPVAIAVITIAGVVHGRLSNRWGRHPDLEHAGKLLTSFPRSFGEWIQDDEKDLGVDVRKILQCAGSFHRVYVNAKTGDVVSAVLIVGPPGPTLAHTPEICLSSQQFERVRGPDPLRITDQAARQHTFHAVEFASKDVSQESLQVVYGWSDGGAWYVPRFGRFTEGGKLLMYKIQIMVQGSGESEYSRSAEVCQHFVSQFIPAFKDLVERTGLSKEN